MPRKLVRKVSSLLGPPDSKSVLSKPSCDDIKDASYWSELLQDKELQKDPATQESFYSELKIRIMRNFGSIDQAFQEIDAAGDGSINFNEWNNMLHFMHLPLENRACRLIFQIVSGGDKEISLPELKVTLLQPTLKKLKSFMRSYKRQQDRIKQNVQSFLTQLATNSQETQVAGVDRLQRKMKIPFCKEIFDRVTSIQNVKEQLDRKNIYDVSIERVALGEMLANSIGCKHEDGGILLESQVPLMMSIFARVGNYKGASISLVDLMTALAILSTDVDRCGKLRLLFEVFDTDDDGVLEDHQIQDLFCRICKTRPLFQGNQYVKQDSGIAFQEELSQQEGLRSYESLRWRLQRSGNNEEAVNFHELWAAIRDQFDVLTALMPAPPLIRWALDPIAVQIEDMLPRATIPHRSQRLSELLASHPALILGEAAIGNASKKPSVVHSRGGPRLPSRPLSKEFLRPSSRESNQGGRSAGPQGDWWHDNRRPQTTEYRKDVTEGFQTRLRRLGRQRVFELHDGFNSMPDLSSGSMAAVSSPRSSANDGDGGGSVSDFSSSSTSRPAGFQGRTSLLPPLGAKENTKGKTSGGQRNSFSRGQRSCLSKASSAPAGLRASTSGSDGHAHNDRLPFVDSSVLEVLKGGSVAAQRHRLLVASHLIAAKENPAHGHGHCLDNLDAFNYKCNLCTGTHALNPKDRDKLEDIRE